MITVRCDSCGETSLMRWYKIYFVAQAAHPEMNLSVPETTPVSGEAQVCSSCSKDFLSGKLHADATIDHSKL